MDETVSTQLIRDLWWASGYNQPVGEIKKSIAGHGEGIVPALIEALVESHTKASEGNAEETEPRETRRNRQPIMEARFRIELKDAIAQIGLSAFPHLDKASKNDAANAARQDIEEIRGRIEKTGKLEPPATMRVKVLSKGVSKKEIARAAGCPPGCVFRH